MKKLSIHIVENENSVARNLAEMLKALGHHIADISSHYDELVGKLPADSSDLFLVNIEPNDTMNGINVAIELDKRNLPHIYISAQTSGDVLMHAKRTNAYGYIIKPYDVPDITVAIEMASGRLDKERENQTTFINTGTGKLQVQLKDIQYAQADGNYTHLHMDGRVYTVRGNLKTSHGLYLNNAMFQRVHKSYVVNTTYIEKITKNYLVLKSGFQIPMGKRNFFG